MDYQYAAFYFCFLSFTISSYGIKNVKNAKNTQSYLKEQPNSTTPSTGRLKPNKTKTDSLKVRINPDDFFANDSAGLGDPNYPLGQIERYFKLHPEHVTFFKPTVPQLGNRGGWTKEDEHDEGESLCNIRKNPYYAPQILPNIQGVKKTIINHAELQQFIEIERCVRSNSSDFRCANLRLGYTSICKQNYRTVKLASFNSTVGISYDLFKVPACCVCKLIKMD